MSPAGCAHTRARCVREGPAQRTRWATIGLFSSIVQRACGPHRSKPSVPRCRRPSPPRSRWWSSSRSDPARPDRPGPGYPGQAQPGPSADGPGQSYPCLPDSESARTRHAQGSESTRARLVLSRPGPKPPHSGSVSQVTDSGAAHIPSRPNLARVTGTGGPLAVYSESGRSFPVTQ